MCLPYVCVCEERTLSMGIVLNTAICVSIITEFKVIFVWVEYKVVWHGPSVDARGMSVFVLLLSECECML